MKKFKNMSIKTKKKVAIGLGAVLVVIIVIVGGNLYIDSLLNKMADGKEFNEEEVYVYENPADVDTILLLGVDIEESDGSARSDVMKLISLDNDNDKIKITSLQRDNLVYLPMIDMYNNLNHAYKNGGVQSTLSTINYNFDLDVTQYISFNFQSVTEIVDILGGVSLYLTDAEASVLGISGGGQYILDGEETLSYMRIRSLDSDYVRMERQNNVISSILTSVTSKDLGSIVNLANKCIPFVETNIPNDDVKSYVMNVLGYDLSTMPTFQFPSDASNSILKTLYLYGCGPHYVIGDFAGEVELLHKNIFEISRYEVSENVDKVDKEIKELAGY